MKARGFFNGFRDEQETNMKELTEYNDLSADELRERIAAVRKAAGDRLTVLAHYYAPDEIVDLADYVGTALA